MAAKTNHLAHTLRSTAWWKAKGPVTTGQVYSDVYKQDMLQYKFKVVNGTYIDKDDVPFGAFVRIEPFNKSESVVTVLSTPYDDGASPTPNPIFKVNRVAVFNTPTLRDFIFYEEHILEKSPGNFDTREYGDAHPDTGTYPNHELVFIGEEPIESSNAVRVRYYYAADRVNQENYNWMHTVADIGGNKFSAVRRMYLINRDDYDAATPAMGTSMANVPAGKFTDFSDFVVAKRKCVDSGIQELDSLYIFEERIYVKKVTISESGYDNKNNVALKTEVTLYYREEIYSGSHTIEDATTTHFATYFGKIGGNIVTFKQLSDNWWSVISTTDSSQNLLNYTFTYPSYMSLSIPDTLKTVDVIWSVSKGDGSYESDWTGSVGGGINKQLSGSENANATGSLSIKGAPVIEIERGFRGQVPVTVHFFYCDKADVTTRINNLGSSWPKFLPKSHTLVIHNVAGTVTAKANASANFSYRPAYLDSWSKNEGEGKSVNVNNSVNTVIIPPTIHGTINIGGLPAKNDSCSASCNVGWTGSGGFPSTAASSDEQLDLSGTFSPSTLAATTPASVPTSGDYVLAARVSPYENDLVQVAVSVFDASYLA